MRFFPCMVLALGLSASPFVNAADQKLASVEVTVDGEVAKKTSGVRTLYVIVYDNESKMPMPYGALKVDLKADAKGSIYKGDITMANLQRMNPDAPAPKSIRLKARLDKDGAAGKDQSGDAVGQVDSVKVGDAAKILINKTI
ncbi:hypothetical protein [Oligoflexus tunisiensis]|uniref:hypothetical protein n=1 Tax=Oligoflexus tunisiensis TaxID=708132 RepID=UPI00114CA526|nr:hypothetical protein [Oligoflexus tunisiensis]